MPTNKGLDWWAKNKPEGYTGTPDLPVEEPKWYADPINYIGGLAGGAKGFAKNMFRRFTDDMMNIVDRDLFHPRRVAQFEAPYAKGLKGFEVVGNNLMDVRPDNAPIDTNYGLDKWLQGRARFQALADRERLFPRGFQRPEGVVDPYDFTDRYNTQLTPEEEAKFQQWAKENNALGDLYDYDVRGAWKELTSGTMSKDARGHLGDTYKKPNHPTFSDQSIYHGKDGFVGGSWISAPNGQSVFFNPSNSTNMMPKSGLQGYMLYAESPEKPKIAYDPKTNSFVNEGSRGTIYLDNRTGDYYNTDLGEGVTAHLDTPNTKPVHPMVKAFNDLIRSENSEPVYYPTAGAIRG